MHELQILQACDVGQSPKYFDYAASERSLEHASLKVEPIRPRISKENSITDINSLILNQQIAYKSV